MRGKLVRCRSKFKKGREGWSEDRSFAKSWSKFNLSIDWHSQTYLYSPSLGSWRGTVASHCQSDGLETDGWCCITFGMWTLRSASGWHSRECHEWRRHLSALFRLAVTVFILFVQDQERLTQVSHFFSGTTWFARYFTCSHFCFNTIQLYTVRYQSWPSGREHSERILVRAWL